MALGDVYTDSEVDDAIDRILPVVNQNRPERPLDRRMVRSMLMTENMGKDGRVTFANAKGTSGETGIAQVMPSTVRALKSQRILDAGIPDELQDSSLPHQVLAGIAAMVEISDRRKTTDPTIIAAEYNGGPLAGKAIMDGGQPNAQVQGYLKKFNSAMTTQNPEWIPPSGTNAQASAVFKASPLDAARASYDSFASQLPTVMEALGVSRSTLQNTGPLLEGAIKSAGDAAAESARQAAEITISEDVTHKEIMGALGLDVRDPNSAIRMELTRKADAQKAMAPLRAKATELQSVSFLQNPFAYLMNIPVLQETVAQYNGLAEQSDQADENVRELQAIGLNAKSLTPARAADSIRAKAAADANAAMSTAQAQLLKTRVDNAAGVAKSILDEYTIKHSLFQSSLQMENTELQRKINLQNLSMHEQAVEEKKLQQKQEEDIAKQITMYRTMLNGPVTPTTVADIKRMSPKQRSEWEEVIQRANFGNTYEDSIPFISTYGNKGAAANAGNAAMMQQVNRLELAATKMIPAIQDDFKKKNIMGGTLKPQDALKIAYADMYAKHVDIAVAGNDKGAIASTPYALDYDAALAAAKGAGKIDNAVIQALDYWKSINPNGKLLGTVTDRQVLDVVASNVAAGKTDPKTAAKQVAEFYKTMSHDTYMSGGLAYIGLPALKDYTITPGQAGKKRLDLMNATTVENYLTGSVATKRAVDSGMFGGSGNLPFFPSLQQGNTQ